MYNINGYAYVLVPSFCVSSLLDGCIICITELTMLVLCFNSVTEEDGQSGDVSDLYQDLFDPQPGHPLF
jgi:hypothetical protein